MLFYHRLMSALAAIRYGFPSRKMAIIGITGTKGKTSTANYAWSVLAAAGLKTGLIGTANIRIGDKESMNTHHMTMPGPFILQKILREMADAGCTHVILEITSEGIKQSRHLGLEFDILLFTNLYPEHLPSHGGSFEKYKETKGVVFREFMSSGAKTIGGKKIPKTIIANADSEHARYYLDNPAEKKITFAVEAAADVKDPGGTYTLSIPGVFNIHNALGAAAIGRALDIPEETIKKGLISLTLIPGRMETIDEGQPFTVIVDYAHEKQSMSLLLATASQMSKENNGKIILLLGAEGGGRDKAKRPAMGELAGRFADYVIVSNVDPYDDDPREIIEDIAKVAERQGRSRNHSLFTIEDRRAGIRKALSLATAGDLVLITGKGSEQSMIIGKKIIPWDDRKVVREEIRRMRQSRI